MKALYALVFVFALVLIPLFGVGAAHLTYLFGVIFPWVAMAIFIVGFVYKILYWAKAPVPFRIPTTGGQQKTLDWIPWSKLDNPSTSGQTVARMFLEIFAFRSLFRNTSTRLSMQDGKPVVSYFSAKWLWLFALCFHYAFLVVLIRHLRLVLEPVPLPLEWVEFLDGVMQMGVPRLYMSDILILAALLFLLLRRLAVPTVRYFSQAADYFPLFLLIGIAGSGVYMRYFAKVDVVAIKELAMGLVTLHPKIPEGIDVSFFIHIFLVSILLAYFPFSKLMHLGGVWLSPTRNMPNDNRIHHHKNPWNPKIKPHSYEAYENDFRDHMREAGLPLDKDSES